LPALAKQLPPPNKRKTHRERPHKAGNATRLYAAPAWNGNETARMAKEAEAATVQFA